jgi:hypothetical protein
MSIIVKFLLLFLGIAGSVVQSIHPFYTPKDLVYEQNLVGVWSNDNGRTTIKFTKSPDMSYLLTYNDDSISAHLFKLGNDTFLDTIALKNVDRVQPIHSITKLWIKDDQFYISLLDVNWIKNQIERGKINLNHKKINGGIVLTASTKDLQQLILKYTNDTSAFEIPAETWKRMK